MIRKLPFLVILLFNAGCFTIKRTAVSNSGDTYNFYKMRDLGGKEYAYMFRDFQRKERFSDFLMYKFNIKKHQTKGYIPVEINKANFYILYDRFEEEQVTLNLLPILLHNLNEDEEDHDSYTIEENENDVTKDFTLSEKYDFVIIKVYDSNFENALTLNSLYVNITKDYVQKLKEEYKQFLLSTKPY